FVLTPFYIIFLTTLIFLHYIHNCLKKQALFHFLFRFVYCVQFARRLFPLRKINARSVSCPPRLRSAPERNGFSLLYSARQDAAPPAPLPAYKAGFEKRSRFFAKKMKKI
ncbi:MAG: hypothetical protein II621_08015, partial [Clostridia bacterium]|nr:hypothetical protein [Clostridia bacterium]